MMAGGGWVGVGWVGVGGGSAGPGGALGGRSSARALEATVTASTESVTKSPLRPRRRRSTYRIAVR